MCLGLLQVSPVLTESGEQLRGHRRPVLLATSTGIRQTGLSSLQKWLLRQAHPKKEDLVTTQGWTCHLREGSYSPELKLYLSLTCCLVGRSLFLYYIEGGRVEVRAGFL